MKKLLLFLFLLLPISVFATTAIPWIQKNPTDLFMYPNLLGGTNLRVLIGQITEPTGSTFNDLLDVASSTANDFAAIGIWNTNNGACASAEYDANNNASTLSTNYASFGITGGNFTGSGCANNPFPAFGPNSAYSIVTNGNYNWALGSTSSSAQFRWLTDTNGDSQFTSADTKMILSQAGYLGVGSTTPDSPVTISNNLTSFAAPQAGTELHIAGNGINSRITVDTYNAGVTGAIFQGRSAAGTNLVPLPPSLDQTLGGFAGDGYGTTGFHNVSLGGFFVKAESTPFTNTSAATYLGFYTTATTTISSSEKMRITSTGSVGIGTSSPVSKLTIIQTTTGNAAPGVTIDGATNTANADMVLNRANNSGTESNIDFNTAGVNEFQLGLQNNSSNDFELWDGSDSSIFVVNHTTLNAGFGTTTPGSLFSIGGNGTGWNFFNNGTTTSAAKGINLINGGCFAINGTCISGSGGGGSGSVSGLAGQLGYFNTTGTSIVGTSTNPLYVDAVVATSTVATSTFLGNVYMGDGTNYGFQTGAQPLEISGTNNFPYQEILSNKSLGGFALSGYTLANSKTTNTPNPFVDVYYGGMYMAGSGFNTYPGLMPDNLVIVNSDSSIRYAALSSILASSTMTWSVGPGFTIANYDMVLNSTVGGNGYLGISTSTPQWPLQVNSTTTPQLALGDGVNSQWTFRNAGGNLYIGPASPLTFATSTPPVVTWTNAGFEGLGTSTPPSPLTIGTTPTTLVSLNPILLIGTSTLVAASASGTYMGINSPTGFNGNFFDFQKTGVSKFKVDNNGNITATAANSGALTTFTLRDYTYQFTDGNGSGFSINQGSNAMIFGSAQARLGSTYTLGWSSSQNSSGAANDINLSRLSAGIVVVGTGTQGSSIGQLAAGKISVGTTSTPFILDVASTSASATFKAQIGLTDTSATTDLKHWTMTSKLGSFYLSTSTDLFATSSRAAFAILPSGVVEFGDYANCNGTNNALGITSGQLICDTLVSDERLKKDIHPFTDGLNIVDAVQPQSYYYKDNSLPGLATGDTSIQYGIIAQDLQKVAPELVTKTTPSKYTPDGTLTYNRDAVIQVLWNSVRELSQNEGISVKRSIEEDWQWLVIGLLLIGFVYQQKQINNLKKK